MEEIPNNKLGCIVHPVNKGIFTISTVFQCIFTISMIYYVVVSNIFYFHPYLGQILILIDIFPMGWNHQPVLVESLGHIFTPASHTPKGGIPTSIKMGLKGDTNTTRSARGFGWFPKFLRKKRWQKKTSNKILKMFGENVWHFHFFELCCSKS